MTSDTAFDRFIVDFFALFSSKTFRGDSYLTYLQRPRQQRTNDEAPIVDTAIVGPLLGLLGFAPGESYYNQQRANDRPDFAPSDPVYGVCFMVENKNTSLDLTLDLADPDSHLSQLAGYVRGMALRLGWLTNGRTFYIWDFATPALPHITAELDVVSAISAWQAGGMAALAPTMLHALRSIYDCRRVAFSDPERQERELAIDLAAWQAQALPLGTAERHEAVLVEVLQALIGELQRDALHTLADHLDRRAIYERALEQVSETDSTPVVEKIAAQRVRVLEALDASVVTLGLAADERDLIAQVLIDFAQDERRFVSKKALVAAALAVINAARQRKYAAQPRLAQPWRDLKDAPYLRDGLDTYADLVFGMHQRRAAIRHSYRADSAVYEDYQNWVSLVQETTLGGMDEAQRRSEFALQAAYVMFIRLLLIRVCEDKGVFANRFFSDGGLKHWQEDIQRYLAFANGNPYAPLLDMAYQNAQNIYAHFFTGRELFNWYRLDRARFVMALHKLSRFDFANVDSDIIGTIYNTYVGRKEKREKGQYYTPPEIVGYMLDQVGYTPQDGIIGANKRLIDPACGSGSFLVTAAKRLVTAYANQRDNPLALLDAVRENLYGFDLNPFACYLAEVNLLIQSVDLIKQALDAGQRPHLKRFHIYNVDALAKPTGMFSYARFNTLLAEESDEVDQIKRRAAGSKYARGFAYVVANPPYGAQLSDDYKELLRVEWPEVFYGQPDTYTFFFKLGLDLLATNGRLGFITPNTYLMGTNTAALRGLLLEKGRIEQIVDLPQGIWPDANVDCVLLFLHAEADEARRRANTVTVHTLGLRDTLDKLTAHAWTETLPQAQMAWLDAPRNEINIRYDTLLQQIEDACKLPDGTVLRLGEAAILNRGIEPYHSRAQGLTSIFVKPKRELTKAEQSWKPLLDGDSTIGRYEIRWHADKPHLNYGPWLYRAYEPKYFDSPKLLFIRLRNRALKRRLVASYDLSKLYNRHNYSNIIARDTQYDLKYLLALFNSSLLNYWYARQYPDVEVSIADTRQLPIYPADEATQAALVAQVDALLALHSELNLLRERGYIIRQRRDGTSQIEIPYDELLREVSAADAGYATVTLFDAVAQGSIAPRGDLAAPISGNIFVPERFPQSLVLRHAKLWLDVLDDAARQFLAGYLSRPQWHGKTWAEIERIAVMPEDAAAFAAFFAREQQVVAEITHRLAQIAVIDAAIDTRVLDLYGISEPAARARVLGSAAVAEEGEDVEA